MMKHYRRLIRLVRFL